MMAKVSAAAKEMGLTIV